MMASPFSAKATCKSSSGSSGTARPSMSVPGQMTGAGPVDYKITFGAKDKTLIEMKLAKNTALERNLQKQLPIY
jgi:hypothetical protein